MSYGDSVGKNLKRELVRSAMLQVQGRSMKSMMNVFGASEPVVYEDVTDTLNVAYVNREETALAMDINYHMLKRCPDVVFLHDLLTRYADTPIRYDDSAGERVAFIMHTSGTTQGTRKFLPFTDKVMNQTQNMMPKSFHGMVEGPDADKPFRVLQVFDFSSIMSLAGQVIAPLLHGDAVVCTFFGFMHPKFIRAIDYYNIDVIQITGFMVDKWLGFSGIDNIDFSSLKVVGMSGGYISPEKMARYRKSKRLFSEI